MATPSNLTHLAFAAPLDESVADEILDPMSGFPVLQNVRQNRRGSLGKRLGCDPITATRLGAADRASGRRIVSHQGRLPCIIDASGAFDIFDDGLQINVPTGTAPEASASTQTLTAPGDTLYGSVACNGFIVTLSRRQMSASVFDVLATIETVSGSSISSGVQLLAATSYPIGMIGTYGTQALAVLAQTNSATIKLATLDCTSAATAAAGWTVLGTALATNKNNTASVFPTGPEVALSLQSLTASIAIAYVNNSGGASQVTILEANITGALQLSAVNTNSVTPVCVGIEGSNADTIWVAHDEGGDVFVEGRDPTTFATVKATASLFTTGYTAFSSRPPFIVSGSVAGTCTAIVAAGSNFLRMRSFTTVSGGLSPVASAVSVVGAVTAGRPFRRGERLYGLFADPEVGNLVLCDWTDAPTTSLMRPVGTAFPELTTLSSLANFGAITTGTTCAYPISVRRSQAGLEFALVTFDFVDPNLWRPAAHNGVTFFAGGLLSYFDGRRVAECSFLHRPAKPTPVDAGTGSTGPDTGTHNYVVTYEEIDADGSWCLSGASVPTSVSTTGHLVNVGLTPICLTARLSTAFEPRVRIVVWRTIAGGAPPYYFVGEVVNSTTAFGSFADTFTDAEIARNRTLYGSGNLPGTNGAALQRDAPPYCADVVSYAGMLVIASGSDLWWSGQTVPGEGTWFSSESFFLTVDGAGDITALAVLDGTLYVFKDRSIYAVSGEPPSDNAASGGLGQPYLVASDVGCISAASLVVTSLGIFFQSHRGIEILAGGSRPAWIGEKIRTTLDAFPVVTSAVIDAGNSLVRFSLATSLGADGAVSGDGRDLIFSLDLNDWQSVDDKTGATANQASQDACVVTVGGVTRYAWLGADGIVRVENLASDGAPYFDNGVWITMAAETGWFKLAGIQGRQQMNRLLMMARSQSPAALSVAIGYNYAVDFATAQTWTSAQVAQILTNGWPITQLRQDPNDEAKGQSVRVRIEDADPDLDNDGTGEGLTWLALTLDITPQPGIADVPQEAA